MYVPLGIFLGILVLGAVAPPLGVIAGIFIPAPLILIYLRFGKQVGLISIAVIFAGLLVVTGAQRAILFVTEYAIVAVILGETIRWAFPYEKSILFGTIGSVLLSAVLIMVIVSNQDTSLVSLFEEEFRKGAEQYIKAVEGVEKDPQEIETLRKIADRVSEMFAVSFPALMVVGSLATATINYLFVRWLWRRYYLIGHYFEGVDLKRFLLPDEWVWLFIVSAGLSLLGDGVPLTLGLNLTIVMAVLYCLQGFSVVLHLMTTKNINKFFRYLVFFLVFTQPVLMGLVGGMGLFDIWADFRKLRTQLPEELDDDFEE